jgi:phenylacetate-CoA ligase
VVAADVGSRAALAKLPVTRKSDLGDLQGKIAPFGGFNTTAVEGLARIYLSPGPIFDPEGRQADWWRFARPMHAAGFRAGQIVQNCFSYHFTPAAFMADMAAQKIGCPVIPAGTGNTELQIQAMVRLGTQSYVGTPSFLKIILEKAIDSGADISRLKRALVGGEALPGSLRTWLQEHGVEHVLQLYASADLGSIAYETMSEGRVNPGMILDEDVILEIVRPGTGDPLAEGEVGEVVVTSLNADYPLIRFGTGDLSAVLSGQSSCGRTNMRIRGWLGRADQTTKVRAMFVHPSQIADIVRRHPKVCKARLVVTGQVSEEVMTLHCEVEEPSAWTDEASASLKESIRNVTKLRAEVAIVAPGSLPNDGKVIVDERVYD